MKNKSLDDIFQPLGELTAPSEELLNGTLDRKIFEEVFGKPITKKKKGKYDKKNRSCSNVSHS
jgi:hypothetical protein